MQDVTSIICCACGNTIRPLLVMENTRDGWHIVRCPQCLLTFVHPQPSPESITAYYNGMYSELATAISEEKLAWARRSVVGYRTTLDKLGGPRHKRLLDLGGGLGYYAKAFAEAGFDVTCVEQDPVSAAFAREKLQLSVVREESAEQFFARNHDTYDVVFLRHVIEHATDPALLVKNVSGCLAEHGVLIIETDNNAGIELLFRPETTKFYLNLYRESFKPVSFLSLLRRRPFAIDPPRHLFAFRKTNLSALLRRHALTPVHSVCYRLGHPIYWPNLPLPTFMQIMGNLGRLKLKRVLYDVGELALLPVRLLLEARGLGSGICIYARKEMG